MKIRDLFLKPVDRPIDGVIKADDDRNLQIEIEEYVEKLICDELIHLHPYATAAERRQGGVPGSDSRSRS